VIGQQVNKGTFVFFMLRKIRLRVAEMVQLSHVTISMKIIYFSCDPTKSMAACFGNDYI
jgi:hypothetical protein